MSSEEERKRPQFREKPVPKRDQQVSAPKKAKREKKKQERKDNTRAGAEFVVDEGKTRT